MNPGDRNDLITFQRFEQAENAAGEPVDNAEPTVIGQEWAQVIYGKGSERREAARESASIPATFRVLSNPMTRSIGSDALIAFDDGLWDIESNVPLGRDKREITAVRQA